MKPKGMSWQQYAWLGTGRRLTQLGERFNISWLIYNPVVFAYYQENAAKSAPHVMRSITQCFPNCRRFLDVGAGSGTYASELKRLGFDVIACEHSSYGRKLAKKQGIEARPFDLNSEPPAEIDSKFDLAYCFEVAEHLPPPLGDKLVSFIAQVGRQVVFTAAPPGQGGTGHINEQPKEYWVERFAKNGKRFNVQESAKLAERFRVSELIDAPWFAMNTMVFDPQ